MEKQSEIMNRANELLRSEFGVPAVSRRLGHSSIDTTTKVYVHAIQAADEIASDIIGDKLDLKKKKD